MTLAVSITEIHYPNVRVAVTPVNMADLRAEVDEPLRS